MSHVFQRVVSTHETQAGFSLEYQKKLTRHIFNIYIHIYICSLSIQSFYKQIVSTHFYLMVCVRTLKGTRRKTKIRDASISQRQCVQAE